MIKIIHVISDSNIGGAGRYLLTYLANVDRSAFEPILVVPTGSRLIAEAQKLGAKVMMADGMAERSFSLKAVWQLWRIFRREKPQIVHAHACLSARLAARLAGGIRVCYTRHSVFPQKKLLTSPLGQRINGVAAKLLSDRIIAVAEAAKKNLTDTGIPSSMAEVIYNGVNPLPVSSAEEIAEVKARFGTDGFFTAGILARLEEVKGHAYLIDAFHLLKQRGRKVKLIIAGTGGIEDTLKEKVREQGLEDTVIMAGFVTDVAKLVNILDVQMNASYGTEAASLALMEGMSLGKPTIASDYGGNPELIGDTNGIVVPQKDADALADAVEKLMDDPSLYQKLSEGAKTAYETRFTAEIMTQQMEDFYKRLVNKR